MEMTDGIKGVEIKSIGVELTVNWANSVFVMLSDLILREKGIKQRENKGND